MKKVLVSLLVLVSVGFSLSYVNIVSPKEGGSYFLGEQIPIAGSVGSDSNCYGNVAMRLDGSMMEMVPFNFTANSVVSLDTIFSIKNFTTTKGAHVFEISGTCTDTKKTSFNTTDQLDIVYELNRDRVLVGEEVQISAYAFRREKLFGKTKIYSPNIPPTVDNARVSFSELGVYQIRITAEDEFRNSGEVNFNIIVSNKLIVTGVLEKQTFKPSENVSIQFSVTDEFWRFYENYGYAPVLEVFVGGTKVGYIIERGGGFEYPQGAAQAPDKLIFVMPDNTPSGDTTIKITASFGNSYGEKVSDVNIERIIKSVEIKVDKETVEKGDEVGINLFTYDQTDDSFIINAQLFVIGPDNKIVLNTNIESFKQQNLKIENNFKEGTYVVKVSIDGSNYLTSFNVVKKDEKKEKTGAENEPNVTVGGAGMTGEFTGGGDVAVGALLLAGAGGLGAYWYLKVKKK